MGKKPMGVGKRRAEAPREYIDDIQSAVSKSDLMEVAWDLAGLCNEGSGCDDNPSTRAKLLKMINARRASRSKPPLNLK
jgi:hypothetical protein